MPESPEANSFQDFALRFGRLAEEAKAYGLQSIWALCENGRAPSSGLADFVYRGGYLSSWMGNVVSSDTPDAQ